MKATPEAVEIPLLRAESLVAQGKLDHARDVLGASARQTAQTSELWTALARFG